jgi:uncharacterized membrane protein YphA (DoxX/SURF4 family)
MPVSLGQKRCFAMFPEGLAGAGLLLLRISCALATGATVRLIAPLPLWVEAGVVTLAIGLLVGVLTRPAAIAAVALQVFVGFAVGAVLIWLVASMALALSALAMTGPGAYSIDARLFGRRVITLELPGGDGHGD